MRGYSVLYPISGPTAEASLQHSLQVKTSDKNPEFGMVIERKHLARHALIALVAAWQLARIYISKSWHYLLELNWTHFPIASISFDRWNEIYPLAVSVQF